MATKMQPTQNFGYDYMDLIPIVYCNWNLVSKTKLRLSIWISTASSQWLKFFFVQLNGQGEPLMAIKVQFLKIKWNKFWKDSNGQDGKLATIYIYRLDSIPNLMVNGVPSWCVFF
jgi:hypothetical protein